MIHEERKKIPENLSPATQIRITGRDFVLNCCETGLCVHLLCHIFGLFKNGIHFIGHSLKYREILKFHRVLLEHITRLFQIFSFLSCKGQ